MRLRQRKLSAGLLAGLALCVCTPIWAQETSASGAAAKPAMMAKDADLDWEVVTVRPTDPNGHGGPHSAREVVVDGQTVQGMLLFGCGLHPRQLVNAPDWTATERWDVRGIPDAPGRPSLRQMQGLVCKVVRERFGLVSHTEQREMAVYALMPTKSGAKLQKSAGDPNGLPSDNEQESGGQVAVRAENMSMGEFALLLKFFTDRPVVDQTGLSGRFDFQLNWTADESKAPTDGSAAPSLFTAIEEQLGLRLEPVKTATDVMVIDKVERPGEN
jgi:uncharacterized protein (TIGR03435 family)